jgi:glycosyltransferase involved in cell wall biosynthesis
MSMVFINNALETFTPTQSGAVATHIWECVRVAQNQGIEPLVISRNCEAAPYSPVNLILLDYPHLSQNRFLEKVFRAERKLTGWRYLREKTYARRVVRAIRRVSAQKLPLVLHNDPELAVYLRGEFPRAFIVHHFHNPLPCKPRFEQHFARSCNVITGVSDFISRSVERIFNLSEGIVPTIYNGIDHKRFSPAPTYREQQPVINFVGRTGIEKAPDLVLRAAKEVAKERTDFSVQILGSNHWHKFEMDDYQRELQRHRDDLEQVGVTVRTPGHVGREALPEELRKAHIHVVPSRWDEPCALTIFEGMAAGLATVASRTGGTPEIVNGSGLLFERDSLEELAAHLEKLITNPELRAEYGRRARARAEKLTWDRTWEQVRGLFEEIGR